MGTYSESGNLRIAKKTSAGIQYYHKDRLGSSAIMTNADGSIAETTEYAPFGPQRAHTGTEVTNYKYTDKELDSETGLYYYGSRYYDPMIGRFISPDTIVPNYANPQSLNRYAYCLNNPMIYVDPTGHFPAVGEGPDGSTAEFWNSGEYLGFEGADPSFSDDSYLSFSDIWETAFKNENSSDVDRESSDSTSGISNNKKGPESAVKQGDDSKASDQNEAIINAYIKKNGIGEFKVNQEVAPLNINKPNNSSQNSWQTLFQKDDCKTSRTDCWNKSMDKLSLKHAADSLFATSAFFAALLKAAAASSKSAAVLSRGSAWISAASGSWKASGALGSLMTCMCNPCCLD